VTSRVCLSESLRNDVRLEHGERERKHAFGSNTHLDEHAKSFVWSSSSSPSDLTHSVKQSANCLPSQGASNANAS